LNFYDIAYSAGLALSAPIWGLGRRARARVRQAFDLRMGDVPNRYDDQLAVMIHAVSLGEMNATRALIDALRVARSDLRFIVCTTTHVGFDRGTVMYGQSRDVTLIRYPLDFSSAIARVLDRMRPSLVVLMELELWPNFLKHCEMRRIPVILANGRITEPSYKRYRLLKPVVTTMLKRLGVLCVQDETYAKRFIDLGAPKDHVIIAGTMKFDTALITDQIDGEDLLADEVGVSRGRDLLWTCGSTGPGEEEMLLDVYAKLKPIHPELRLAIIPRHPQRFDEVAALIESRKLPLKRRSTNNPAYLDAIILGDTMGELRKFYSLANVVFVGRSLVDLGHRQHGSDMIEPAALGKPVIVGKFTTNFADAMIKFRQSDAIVEVGSERELHDAMTRLLSDTSKAKAMGDRAQLVVRQQQGSTHLHANAILKLLPPTLSGAADQ